MIEIKIRFNVSIPLNHQPLNFSLLFIPSLIVSLSHLTAAAAMDIHLPCVFPYSIISFKPFFETTTIAVVKGCLPQTNKKKKSF
jgi:hypothetical protein